MARLTAAVLRSRKVFIMAGDEKRCRSDKGDPDAPKISRLFDMLVQLHMEQEATGEIESLTGEKGERTNDGLADLGSIVFVDAAIWSCNL
jgi:hypothetical protein